MGKHEKLLRSTSWTNQQRIAALEIARREIECMTDDDEAIRDTLEGEADLDSIVDEIINAAPMHNPLGT